MRNIMKKELKKSEKKDQDNLIYKKMVNSTIAEYLGWNKVPGVATGSKDLWAYIPNNKLSEVYGIKPIQESDLKFHLSFDWIMPVDKKVYNELIYDCSSASSIDYWISIEKSNNTFDISKLVQSIIDGIKLINREKIK